jgi:hypothetical protein
VGSVERRGVRLCYCRVWYGVCVTKCSGSFYSVATPSRMGFSSLCVPPLSCAPGNCMRCSLMSSMETQRQRPMLNRLCYIGLATAAATGVAGHEQAARPGVLGRVRT